MPTPTTPAPRRAAPRTAPPGALPLSLIAGYLGAGKTTLVNHLLRNAQGRRIAVLVNDFGELNIDADLIVGQQGDVIRLAGGCVCCQFGSDLVGALAALTSAPGATRPDHLLLEASGIGLPAALLPTLALLPGLRLEAVLVVADAQSLRERAADRYVGDTVMQQLRAADLLLLNKCDGLSAARRTELHAWLRAQAVAAPVLETTHAAAPVHLLLGEAAPARQPRRPPARADAEHDADAIGRWQARPVRRAARPTVASATGHFVSVSLRLRDGLTDLAALTLTLADWQGLLRVKGFVRDATGQPQLLQGVGRRVDLQPAAPTAPTGTLLCIGVRGVLDAEALRARLRAMGWLSED